MASSSNAKLEDLTSSDVLFELGRSNGECYGNRVYLDSRQPYFFATHIKNVFSGWDIKKKQQLFEWDTTRLDYRRFFDASILPDGKQILLAGELGISQVNLWNGSEIVSYEKTKRIDLTYYTVSVRSDGKFGAATGLDGSSHNIPNPLEFVSGSPLPDHLAHIEHDQKLVFMDLENKKTLSTLDFKDSFVKSVQFSKNQRFLITTSYLRVRFWDIADPFNIRLTKEIDVDTLGASGQVFLSVAISPDLRLIALATQNKIFVVSSESGLIITKLDWRQKKSLHMISYLQWSSSGQEIMGTNLLGQIVSWSLLKPDEIVIGEYNNVRGIQISLNPQYGAQPYVPFAIDPNRRYLVRPGKEISTYDCNGLEVAKMPGFKTTE